MPIFLTENRGGPQKYWKTARLLFPAESVCGKVKYLFLRAVKALKMGGWRDSAVSAHLHLLKTVL